MIFLLTISDTEQFLYTLKKNFIAIFVFCGNQMEGSIISRKSLWAVPPAFSVFSEEISI